MVEGWVLCSFGGVVGNWNEVLFIGKPARPLLNLFGEKDRKEVLLKIIYDFPSAFLFVFSRTPRLPVKKLALLSGRRAKQGTASLFSEKKLSCCSNEQSY